MDLIIDYQESEPNPAIVEQILLDPMASEWASTDPKPYELTKIPVDSPEYNTISDLFNRTSRGSRISTLERVENPYLLGHYLLKKEKLKSEGVSFTERSLFHGTHEIFVAHICERNFDWRKYGSSKGHKFGRGVSFAPEVSYARHYTPYEQNVMILAKVLIGSSIFGDKNMIIPPEAYDTSTNGKNTVIVKYEDDDFYPQYVIHFAN